MIDIGGIHAADDNRMIVRMSKTNADIHPLGLTSVAGDSPPMAYDPTLARAALAEFKKSTGLVDASWEKASKVGSGTIRKFEKGPNRSMGPETYSKLAIGASKLLGRAVSATEFSPNGHELAASLHAGWHLEIIRRALCPKLPELLGIMTEHRWHDITDLDVIPPRLSADVAKLTGLPRGYVEDRDTTGVSRAHLEKLHRAALEAMLSRGIAADR